MSGEPGAHEAHDAEIEPSTTSGPSESSGASTGPHDPSRLMPLSRPRIIAVGAARKRAFEITPVRTRDGNSFVSLAMLDGDGRILGRALLNRSSSVCVTNAIADAFGVAFGEAFRPRRERQETSPTQGTETSPSLPREPATRRPHLSTSHADTPRAKGEPPASWTRAKEGSR